LSRADEECVRNLREDAGAVASARIGTNRATVLEIAENLQRVFDDLMRLAALDVGDEADAAGILVEPRVIETLRVGQAGVRAVAIAQTRVDGRARRGAVHTHALAITVLAHPRRSHARPSLRARFGRPLGRRHTFHVSSAGERWPKRSSIEGSFRAAARRHLAP